MANDYGPVGIAAGRAKIAAMFGSPVGEGDPMMRLGYAANALATGWLAALDALEAAQKNEQADGKCIEHWSGRAIEAEASAEVAEAEVERLKEENASLLRRIESLRMPARAGEEARGR